MSAFQLTEIYPIGESLVTSLFTFYFIQHTKLRRKGIILNEKFSKSEWDYYTEYFV